MKKGEIDFKIFLIQPKIICAKSPLALLLADVIGRQDENKLPTSNHLPSLYYLKNPFTDINFLMNHA